MLAMHRTTTIGAVCTKIFGVQFDANGSPECVFVYCGRVSLTVCTTRVRKTRRTSRCCATTAQQQRRADMFINCVLLACAAVRIWCVRRPQDLCDVCVSRRRSDVHIISITVNESVFADASIEYIQIVCAHDALRASALQPHIRP